MFGTRVDTARLSALQSWEIIDVSTCVASRKSECSSLALQWVDVRTHVAGQRSLTDLLESHGY